MKRKLHEIWKVKEGSKTLWKVQCPKGVATFYTKKMANAWVEGWEKIHQLEKEKEAK